MFRGGLSAFASRQTKQGWCMRYVVFGSRITALTWTPSPLTSSTANLLSEPAVLL